jgi:hypothetical protein
MSATATESGPLQALVPPAGRRAARAREFIVHWRIRCESVVDRLFGFELRDEELRTLGSPPHRKR